MTRVPNTTYTALGTDYERATAAGDLFKKEDVQKLAYAVEISDHGVGLGLAVARLKNTCRLQDADATNHFVFSTPSLAADRTVTWPNLTGNDTLVFESQAQTLSNKTLVSPALSGWTAPLNLLANPGFELWSLGPGPFPGNSSATADGWTSTIQGTSTLSVAQDSANADAGSRYAATCTYVHNLQSRLYQALSDYYQHRGRTLTFSVRVKTSTASAVRLTIQDSINGFRYSSFHTGGGGWETLSVSAPIAATAAGAQVGVVFEASCTAQVDNATLAVGTVAAEYQPLHPTEDQDRSRPSTERYVVAPEQNQLVNPGFEVWQRGNGAFTTNTAYTADRWQISLGASSTISVSKETAVVDTGSGAALFAAYTHVTTSRVLQIIEHYLQLRGRTITFSCRVRATVANAVRLSIWDSVNGFRYSGFHTGDSTYQTLSVTAPIAAGATMVQASFNFEATCASCLFDNATLVVGSVPADYTPLTPADDLNRCLRYFEIFWPGVAGYLFCVGLNVTTSRVWGALRWTEKAVAAPAVLISAPADFRAIYGNGTAAAAGAIAVSGPTKYGGLLDIQSVTGSPLTVGSPSLIDSANANARILIEANP